MCNLYGIKWVVKRLRLSKEDADFVRAYSEKKGISETTAIRNMIDNERNRLNKKRLITPI